jgi:hypothetical protein
MAEIEQMFTLQGYWWGTKWCPAVARREEGGYAIRVVKSVSISGSSESVSYDYFHLDEDGTVTSAPHGYARVFKPGLVVDVAQALERYADAPAGARRIA